MQAKTHVMATYTVDVENGYVCKYDDDKFKFAKDYRKMLTMLDTRRHGDPKIYELCPYFHSDNYSYLKISTIANVNKGDTVFVKSTRAQLMYDGITFVDYKHVELCERMQKLETMIADIHDILGYIPGGSSYKKTQKHFKQLADDQLVQEYRNPF